MNHKHYSKKVSKVVLILFISFVALLGYIMLPQFIFNDLTITLRMFGLIFYLFIILFFTFFFLDHYSHNILLFDNKIVFNGMFNKKKTIDNDSIDKVVLEQILKRPNVLAFYYRLNCVRYSLHGTQNKNELIDEVEKKFNHCYLKKSSLSDDIMALWPF